MSRSLVTILGAIILACFSSCDGKKPNFSESPPGSTAPSTEPQPTVPPGPETFDLLDAVFTDTSGWQVDSSITGSQSADPSAGGVELSLHAPFLLGNPSRCLASQLTLKRAGVLKDAAEATLELQFKVGGFPKDAEYWFRLETVVAPGRRLINFTGRGIRTFTPETSLKVSDTVLTPGGHTTRLVAKGETTILYLDGAKLGVFKEGYLAGGTPGDLSIDFALPEKFPASGREDCPAGPATVLLEKLRVASKAYAP